MANRFCKYCGNELTPGTLFCGNCGKPVKNPPPQNENRRCPGCGRELIGSPKFCKYCGAVIMPGSGSGGEDFGNQSGDSRDSSTEPNRRRYAGRLPQGTGYGRSSQGNGTGRDGYGRSSQGNGTGRNGYSRSSQGNGTGRNGYGRPSQGDGSGRASGAGTNNRTVPAPGAQTAVQPAYSQGSFYLIDFFKYVTRSGNIPSLIYLLLNVCIITLVIASGMPDNIPAAIGISLLLYLVSITIALSPIGEFIVRFQNGCKKINDPQISARMQPVFQRVYQKARQHNPSLPDTVQFYMCDAPYPNAFAVGRKTVCITQGLLQMPDLYIEAILGHEFGHLSHHDTDMLLVITVGNMFINFFLFIGRVCMNLMLLIAALFVQSSFGALMHRLVTFLSNLSINLMIWLWTEIGVLLTMKTSRANEFEADHFSGELGYGRVLADALEMLENGPGGRPKGIFAALSASHPPTPDRTARLRNDF